MKNKTEYVTGKNATGGYKRGWNWHYIFSDKTLEDGTRYTVVSERVFRVSACGTDLIVSGFYGGHDYENAAAGSIEKAFRDFFCDANENGVRVKTIRESLYFDAWLIDAPIDSEIVKAFTAALAAINRVSVKVYGPTVEKKEE